jgi:hypothetical protein
VILIVILFDGLIIVGFLVENSNQTIQQSNHRINSIIKQSKKVRPRLRVTRAFLTITCHKIY